MALGNKKRPASKAREEKKKQTYIRIGNIWASKNYEGQINVSADDFFGDLIFRKKANPETGEPEQFYKIKYISAFEPKSFEGRETPEGLLYNLCISLDNEKAVELLSEEETES